MYWVKQSLHKSILSPVFILKNSDSNKLRPHFEQIFLGTAANYKPSFLLYRFRILALAKRLKQ